MRDIKFRAWDKEVKVMLPVEQWANRSWVAVPVQVGEEEWELNQLKLDDIELMQYTGLKDKDGVEIYGGDVIKASCFVDRGDGNFDDTLYIVKFENGAFYGVEPDGSCLDLLSELHTDTEVVANIYQNPELIK